MRATKELAKKCMAIATALTLVGVAVGIPATVYALDDPHTGEGGALYQGETLGVNDGTIDYNWGTINTNNGTVGENQGSVTNSNNGVVTNNYAEGTVDGGGTVRSNR